MEITAGMIGFGHMGRMIHVPALLRNKVQLIGIADRREKSLADVPKSIPTFLDYKDLLDSQPQLIVISTRDSTHAEICVEAIKRGINILVEKPFATTIKEASSIFAYDSGSSKICVMHQYLYFEPFIRLRKAVVEGEVGEIVGARIFFGHGRAHEWWQGVIPRDLPIHVMHPFYVLEWLFGTPNSITGRHSGNNFYGRFETKTGTIDVDVCQLHDNDKHLFKVEVTGTDRSIEAADPPYLSWIGHNIRSDISQTVKTYTGQAMRLSRLLSRYPLHPELGYSLGAYDLLIKDFLKSLQKNSEPPVPLRQALSSLRFAENYTTACNIGGVIAL